MALKLNVTSNKGVPITYYRIRDIVIGDNVIEVVLVGYVSADLREFEKGLQDNEYLRDSLMEKINAELLKPENERDTLSIVEWSNQANDLVNQNVDSVEYELDYSVVSESIKLPLDKTQTISYEDLYTKLKELPEFEDAEDV